MLETPQKLRSTRPRKTQQFHSHMSMSETHALKEKLIREMLDLDKQRENLEIGASQMDFSMVQTYKEMIHSRRMLLNQLENRLG